MNEKRQSKIQTTVTDYHRFVLEGLVGIQGRSKSDVLHYILTSYIEKNFDLLKSADLTVRHWRNQAGKKVD